MPKKKLPKNPLAPYMASILLSYVIWAAAGPVIKLTLDYVPVYTFLLYRFLIVGILVFPYTFLKLKQYPIHKKDYGKIVLLGIFSQTSLAFVFFGLKYTTVLDATLIAVLGPILSVMAGHYLYNERVNIYTKVGLGIASLGTFFVVLEPILYPEPLNHASELRLFGNMLILLNTICFTLYIIWSKMSLGITTKPIRHIMKLIHMKPMRRHYPATLLMSLSFYVGLATFIPLSFLEQLGFIGDQMFRFEDLTLIPFIGILYMAVASSIVAYFAFEWGLSKVEVEETAIFSYLQPIMAMPFAYLILKEVPTQHVIIGSVLMGIGVFIAEKNKKK